MNAMTSDRPQVFSGKDVTISMRLPKIIYHPVWFDAKVIASSHVDDKHFTILPFSAKCTSNDRLSKLCFYLKNLKGKSKDRVMMIIRKMTTLSDQDAEFDQLFDQAVLIFDRYQNSYYSTRQRWLYLETKYFKLTGKKLPKSKCLIYRRDNDKQTFDEHANDIQKLMREKHGYSIGNITTDGYVNLGVAKNFHLA